MSTDSDPRLFKPPPDPPKKAADDALPDVVAPTASFILQLFLIPMVIVMIVVMVWLMFSWLAHMGSDPRELVADLKTLNDASWQKANALSNLLRNPENDYLKDDRELAADLAALLEGELEAGQVDRKRILLRVFLCRALGEFRVDNGLPVLLAAAQQYKHPKEMDVRYASVEALAVMSQNVGADKVRSDGRTVPALLEVSRERGEGKNEAEFAELRSAAAFTLGVIGGAEALDRLERMLDDAHPNARYNAATGLARYGDLRAVPALLEMLDPDNRLAYQGETSKTQRRRKQMLVLMNGIRATQRLAKERRRLKQASDPTETQLRESLLRLKKADLPEAIKVRATDALASFPR